MILEFLGVGSFFAKENHQTNLLINDNILIDCGMTAGRSLYETGRTFAQIEHIFITHTHADHIGGLEECAFYNKYLAGGRKPNLYLPGPLATTLWDYSLRGGLEDSDSGALKLTDYFNVCLADSGFEIDGLSFRVVPTFHVPKKYCCGLSIGGRIYFSGDTQFDANMVSTHGSDAEVIYHDCQFFTGGIHASLEELGTLPEALRRKIWLIHYADDYASHKKHARDMGFRWAKQHTVYTFG